MAESFVQLPADGTGKKLRTLQATVGANTVEHQAVVLCDSSGNIITSLPVTVGNFPSTQTVSGTVSVGNFPATQPVSGTLAVNNLQVAPLNVTATGAAAAAVTASLPAAGAGLFHYICSLEITAYTTAARTGSATPVIVTTTNLTGNPAYTFASAGAIGTTDRLVLPLGTPIKASVANTATTIIAPATTGVIWRINVSYFTAA